MWKMLVASIALASACSPAAPEKANSGEAPARGIQGVPIGQPPALNSAAAAVDAFAAALRAGDRAAVQRLLAANVLIAESGAAERSFAEYARDHMGADMAFTAAVQFTPECRDLIDGGDMATVISQSRAEGAFHGRAIRFRTIETMVLRRVDGAWRIEHIHWSSAPISDEHES